MTATDPATRPAPSTGAPKTAWDPRFLRVARYHALVYRQLWKGSVLTTIIGPILYLVAMGVGVGSLVDAGDSAPLDIPYVEFVAPGLLAA
ncbi:MAG: ABC transporter, partial [Actinomycetota bacterium]